MRLRLATVAQRCQSFAKVERGRHQQASLDGGRPVDHAHSGRSF